MPKCGSCGYNEVTIPCGRTVSVEIGAHADSRDSARTCPGGKLEEGIVNSKTGEIDWLTEPKWTPANHE